MADVSTPLIQQVGGSIGIGTGAPGSKFTVYTGSGAISGTNDAIRLQVPSYNDAAKNTIIWGQDGSSLILGRFGLEWKNSSSQMNFVWRDIYNGSAGSTELMRLQGDGNLGIGSVSPAHKLEVSGNALVSKLFVSTANASYDFYNNGTSYLNGTVNTGGNLIIGSNLTVNGSASSFSVTGNQTLTLTTTGISSGATNRLVFNVPTASSDVRSGVIEWYKGGTTFLGDLRFKFAGGIEIRNSADQLSFATDDSKNANIYGNLTVAGNLTINGTTTTVNSTVTTIDDPIFTLGGDTAPTSDDNKDRGIEFRWHNGTAAKVGFFGFDDSTGYLTFIPDATNSSEVFSGIVGTIQASLIGADVTLGSRTNSSTFGGNTSGLTLNAVAEIRSPQAGNPPAITWHYENIATRHLLLNSSGEFNFIAPNNENSGVAIVKINGNTIATTANNLSVFSATTSSQLAGIISDKTGTGALVFANTPTLVTPNIGAATGTSISLTTSATIGTNYGGYTPIQLSLINSGSPTTGAIRFSSQPDGAGGYITFNGTVTANSSGTIVSGTSTITSDHTSRKTGVFQFIGGTTGVAGFQFFTSDGGTNQILNERLRIQHDGNIGIGTATANYKLTVNGSVSVQGDNAVNGVGLMLGWYNTGGYKWIQSFDSQPLYINPLGNNVVLNSGGGNATIGTATSYGKLTTSASISATSSPNYFDGLALYNQSDGGARIIAVNSVTSAVNPLAAIEMGVLSSGAGTDDGVIRFSTSTNAVSAVRAVIDNNGNVGIGTSSPTATLFVARGGGADGTAVFCGTNAYSHFNYSTSENTYIRGGKTGAIVHLNDSHNGNVILAAGGGNVGIGTASPTNAKLQISSGGVSTQDSTRTFASTTFNSAIGSSDTRTLAFNGTGGSSVWWCNSGTPVFAIDTMANGATFWTYNAGWSQRLQLDGNGFGVNTTAPLVKLTTRSGTNSLPATSGTTQSGAGLRVEGGDNAVIDIGTNSVQTWIQATDKSALNNFYYLMLNPRGGNVGVNTTSNPAYSLEVNGSFAATTKSFVINHPTKVGKKLRYGSLEGPENGVYIRGKLKGGDTIELPEYWTKLIHPDSITVNLTPIGKHQKLYVKEIADNKVIVANDEFFGGEIHCFYTVFGERADVEKLQTEVDA